MKGERASEGKKLVANGETNLEMKLEFKNLAPTSPSRARDKQVWSSEAWKINKENSF